MHYRNAIAGLALSLILCPALLQRNALAESVVNRTPSSADVSQSEWRAQQLVAADKSDGIMRDARKLSGLLAQYTHMHLAYNANHDRAFQVIFGQYLSWYQTFIGDYPGASASFSIAQPRQADDGSSPISGEYHALPAADVILRLATNRKAVFFNEAHSAPITRTLTIELLSKLRAEGFNYFAAETLYDSDPDLQKRGYPTPKSGFYINEPLYGEMVRTALKLGFKVVPYDVENAGVGNPRERAGAKNLAKIFKQDANARLIVDAGFAHIQKSGKYLGGRSMAEFFQEMSHIDPLCIEQTMMIQHARPDQDHPYYLAAIEAVHPTEPIVFVAAGDSIWTLKPKKYDMSVIFPLTKNNGTRPDWLALGGLRVAYPITSDLCNKKSPCLIQAFYADENDDSVPADRAILNVVDPTASIAQRILTDHGNAKSQLFLRPGKYRITATDLNDHRLFARDITVMAYSNGNASADGSQKRNVDFACSAAATAALRGNLPNPDCSPARTR